MNSWLLNPTVLASVVYLPKRLSVTCTQLAVNAASLSTTRRPPVRGLTTIGCSVQVFQIAGWRPIGLAQTGSSKCQPCDLIVTTKSTRTLDSFQGR